MKEHFENESVLSDFFITASRVSEVARRGMEEALKDGPECKFPVIEMVSWRYLIWLSLPVFHHRQSLECFVAWRRKG